MTDSNDYAPSDFVVPVLARHPDGSPGPFLGTGSFVGAGAGAKLLTCDHVLAQWHGSFGIAIEETQHFFEASVVARDPATDLALLRVHGYAPPHSLEPLGDDVFGLNKIVLCFEYGTTIAAGAHIAFSPATRLGNVTRLRNLTDLYGAAGIEMLELSFPALKGASGAPIMDWEPPFRLWGVVKANVSYELLPAQVESIHDSSGKLEEQTKFYLPQALAINVKHVKTLLARAGA